MCSIKLKLLNLWNVCSTVLFFSLFFNSLFWYSTQRASHLTREGLEVLKVDFEGLKVAFVCFIQCFSLYVSMKHFVVHFVVPVFWSVCVCSFGGNDAMLQIAFFNGQ